MRVSCSQPEVRVRIIQRSNKQLQINKHYLHQTWAFYGPQATSGLLAVRVRPAGGLSEIRNQRLNKCMACTQFNCIAFILKVISLFACMRVCLHTFTVMCSTRDAELAVSLQKKKTG